MPSTYTQNLGIQMPADGEQAGTWGDTVNSNYQTLDLAIDGNEQIAFSASSYALVTQPTQSGSQPSEGNNKLIIWTGALPGQGTVNIQPNTAQKLYVMVNATSGGYPILFQQGTGGTFTLNNGYGSMIYTDGGGNAAKCAAANYNPQFGNVLVTGTLVVQGAATYTQPQTFTQAVAFTGSVAITGGATLDSLTLTTGTPNPFDIYYRGAAGSLVPLPIGAVGQSLIVAAGPTLAWGSTQNTIGSVIAGAIPYGVFYANSASAIAQSANIVVNGGLGLGLLPTHALHVGGQLAPEIYLDTNAPATQNRIFSFATNGQSRWWMYTPSGAESGGNAGSNIAMTSWNDGVTANQILWSGFRNTGDMTVGAYSDLKAQLGVMNQNAAQPGLIVQGAASQSAVLQSWRNSAGTEVAHIDNSGNLFVAGGGFLSLNANGRLNLWGSVAGAPLGTIHIGREPNPPVFGLTSSIVLESAGQYTDNMPPGAVRMYYRTVPGNNYGNIVFQFQYNGVQYFALMSLVGQQNSNVTWTITSSQA